MTVGNINVGYFFVEGRRNICTLVSSKTSEDLVFLRDDIEDVERAGQVGLPSPTLHLTLCCLDPSCVERYYTAHSDRVYRFNSIN